MSTRREILGFIGGMTASSLVGCARGQSAASTSSPLSTSVAQAPACIVRPEQTAGPFFLDDRLNRSDLRADPASGVIKTGVPMQLVFQVTQVGDRTCTPLPNAVVDVWHCDAEGVYSGVGEGDGSQFLRGYQTTNDRGIAQFTTIYPGSYPGRAVHIHFKVRGNATAAAGYEFTSQIYFDDALTDRIHARSPYTRQRQRTRNAQDGLFQWEGDQLLLPLVQTETGYRGTFALGLAL